MKKLMILFSLIMLTGCVAPVALDGNEILGAAAGAAIGNQIGGGSGREIATATGAVVGGSIGRSQSRVGVPVQGYPYHPFPTTSRGIPADGYYQRYGACDQETMFEGNYNPPAAQAYCRGRLEREARAQYEYEQRAYRQGVTGR